MSRTGLPARGGPGTAGLARGAMLTTTRSPAGGGPGPVVHDMTADCRRGLVSLERTFETLIIVAVLQWWWNAHRMLADATSVLTLTT